MEALRLAVPLAKSGGAVLDILHVIHNPFDELYMSSITESDPAMIDAYAAEPAKRAKIVRATEEHAEILLKQFCHEAVHGVAKVHYHIRQGDPFENILDASEDFLTDLIVLATHGRTGIKRLVIGNVAEKVVRHARCPVLTVKPKSVHGVEEAAA
jgi:nucleotide-binding universal stress UspA family protein